MTVAVNMFEGEIITKGIWSAIVNRSIYPPNHRLIRKPLEDAHQIIKSLADVHGDLKIGIIANTLFVGDHVFYEANKPVELLKTKLKERHIESMIFQREVGLEEIEVLLEVLELDQEELEKRGGVEKEFGGKGVSHIQVVALKEELDPKEVHFRALKIMQDVVDDLRSGIIPGSERAKQVISDMDAVFTNRPNTVMGLTVIRKYDEYLYTHSVNVGVLSLVLAKRLGYTGSELERIALGGLFHDIGKTEVDQRILSKPGKLTQEEFESIKKHPIYGHEIAGKMGNIDMITACAIIGHHVDYNLQGYPKLGLKELDPYSMIVSLADTYDALSTTRCYQTAHSPYEALEIMKKLGGKKFEPTMLETFVDMVGYYPFGSLVRLSTNEIGIVASDDNDDHRVVKIIFDSEENKLDSPMVLDYEELVEETGKARISATVDPVLKGIDPLDYL